jgi:hypothetical protein
MKCTYNHGYGPVEIIEVVSITPLLHVKERYLNLLDIDGKSYPATWLTWEQQEMQAGCYENF